MKGDMARTLLILITPQHTQYVLVTSLPDLILRVAVAWCDALELYHFDYPLTVTGTLRHKYDIPIWERRLFLFLKIIIEIQMYMYFVES